MLLLLLLVAANLLWLHASSSYSRQNDSREKLEQQIDHFSQMSLEEGREQIDQLLLELDWTEALEYGQISTQIDHLLSYDSYIQGIQSRADRMITVSIFAESEFAKANIRKTAEDYGRMEGVELTMGNDLPAQWMVLHQGGGWLAALFVVLVIWSFLAERKSGLWNMICASPHGRHQLARSRFLTVVSAAALAGFTFTASELLYCYSIWGGWEELGRMAQSVSVFKELTVPMTIGQLWWVYLSYRILGLLGVGLTAWMLLELITDRRLVPTVWALVLGVSWLLQLLPEGSLFRYLNVLVWMQPMVLLTSYCNLDLFGHPIGQTTVVLGAAAAAIPLAAVTASVIYERRKPVASYRWLDQMLERVGKYTVGFGQHVSLYLHELYRIMSTGRGWKILAIATIAVILTASPVVNSSAMTDKYLERYYRQSQGPVGAATEEYLMEQQEQLQAQFDAMEQLQAELEDGLVSQEEYSRRMLGYEHLEDQQLALEAYQSHLSSLQQTEGSYILPHWVFEKLLGVSGQETARIQLISSVAIVLLFAGVAGIERRTGMLRSRRASARGRKDIRLHRHGAAWLICAVFGGGLWGLYFWLLWMDYDAIPWLDAPVRCLSFIEQEYGNLSILGYYLLQAGMRTLWLCLLASLILAASEVRDTYEA